MICSVNGASSLGHDYQTQPATSKPPAQQPASSKQDSVQLSAAAKAAAGDVDHDGDSK
jgi:hypothetical protein